MVAGNFFPLHDGHCQLLDEARKLGHLIAIVGTDDYLALKGKELVYLSLVNRVRQLRDFTDEIAVVDDKDGTCTKTLRRLRPDIFVKGEGDVLPQSEVDMCGLLGCEIRYIGKRLWKSSELLP